MKIHIYRRLDELGRVVLPTDCLRSLEWDASTRLSFRLQDNGVLIYPTRPACVFCGWEIDLTQIRGRCVCSSCIKEICAEKSAT